MPAEPAVKGTIFRTAAEEVRQLVEEGRLRADELPEADRALVEDKILDAGWYPMESYVRLTDLLCRRVGRGRTRYYHERGEQNAERLMRAGLYSQLSFLERWKRERERRRPDDRKAMVASYASNLRRITSMAASIYSVGRWEVVEDPDDPERVRIEVTDASAYSEGMRYAIEGFLNGCARAVRPEFSRLFATERPAQDHIRIRMSRSIPELLGAE